MTAKDTITLPRKHIDYAAHALEHFNKDASDPLVSEIIHHLRTALAAEQPKPEPVAWQERHFFPKVGEWTHWYDCRPRMADYPREQIEQNGVRYQWRPLYPAPPATHPGYVIGSHWLETAYSRVCAGEAEADVLRDCGWERVDEAMRRDAEKWRKAQAKYIAWQKGGKAEAMEDER